MLENCAILNGQDKHSSDNDVRHENQNENSVAHFKKEGFGHFYCLVGKQDNHRQ